MLGKSSLALALVALAAGCTESNEAAPKTPSAEERLPKFTFAPPNGTTFTRTETRSYTTTLLGTPFSRSDEEELRWHVSIGRAANDYLVTQELVHARLKRNDKVVLDTRVPPGEIAAQLVVSAAGELVGVRGLEKTSTALKAAAGADLSPADEQALSPASLKALVAARYAVLFGDLVGRPVKVGTSWTIPGREGGPVVSRTIKLESVDTCGETACARLRQDVKLEPSAMHATAQALVADFLRAAGDETSTPEVNDAALSMAGTFVTEPMTMLVHEAALDENGRVSIAVGDKTAMVQILGFTRFTYDYGKERVARVVAVPANGISLDGP